MAALSEEFGFELEALRATYGEDEVAMLPGAACARRSRQALRHCVRAFALLAPPRRPLRVIRTPLS